MYKKTEVQPAKTGRGQCKKCRKVIEKGQLRAKIVDDRQFREYLRRHPDARGCEGYSRGYFQTGTKVISIQKYFVHLKCYKPIYPHPIQEEYFKLTGAKAADKQKFKEWLQSKEKGNQQEQEEPEKKSKPKKKSKRNQQ